MPFSSELPAWATWLKPCLDHAAFLLPYLLFTSIATMGALILSGRHLAKTLKRSSYDKGARQLTQLASIAGWILVVAVQVLFFLKWGTWFPTDMEGYLLEMLWIMLCMTVFLISLQHLLWKFLSSHRILLFLLAALSLLQGLTTAVCATGLGRLLLLNLPLPKPTSLSALEQLAKPLIPINFGPFHAFLLILLPLLFAMPHVFGQIGFLLLRQRQDYGRDHYTTVLGWTAACARNRGLLLFFIFLLALALEIYESPFRTSFDPLALLPFLPQLISLAIWLFCSVAWSVVAKSAIPMRHKALIVVADLLAILSVPLIMGSCWLNTVTG